MSNYEPINVAQVSSSGNSNAQGSQHFVVGGSQMIRQGKVKARQVSSIKDGFKQVDKKGGIISTNTSYSNNQNQQVQKMVTKSIQDGKMNYKKP